MSTGTARADEPDNFLHRRIASLRIGRERDRSAVDQEWARGSDARESGRRGAGTLAPLGGPQQRPVLGHGEATVLLSSRRQEGQPASSSHLGSRDLAQTA